ncbi:hypothetical protein Sme01_66530 [Sphaerisporangium melleum]|uniref:Predicted membrane protein YciQ-like C-terminal domain-containing protein n=1 Tax=Sphaerisporangium melleum TaxID=321316 RepID=A0A917VPZ2_9ACTN|nr:DUF2207 domain-containing protein [Sphaerisporangium melleum]GGL06345.1 hypothetical protein GCM10007964_55760 [Sphaerisporangium melleum]GII74177.1 hypothetical protein Sme01_66530 [Sphaerisporangium melleum]
MVWFLAAAAALGLWLALVAALAYATRNPAVTPAPPTADLGEESPAVVDLITGDWRLCDEAASATLLDLAARGAVQIEEIGPELSLVRLRTPRAPLAPHEKLVLDHVTSLATDGVVATGALAEGARDLQRWWKSFRRKVIAEARRQGLSRPRWSRAQALVLTIAAAAPALATGVAVFATADTDDRGGGIGAAIIAFAALFALAERLNGERGTARGAEAAGRWLGVRAHLASGNFAERPAAAVTIWGRHLAYAAALGLAGRAVTSLPVSVPADDRRAWSDYGGLWHVVDVRYPRRILWGRPPRPVVFGGVVAGLATGFWLWLAGVVAGDVFDLPDLPASGLAFLGGGVAAAVPIAFAVADLAARAEIVGQVIRLRAFQVDSSEDDSARYAYWVAVDDGHRRRVKAFGIGESLWRTLAEGDVIRARAGRRLGWVHAVEVLRRSRHRGASSYDDTGEHPLEAPENLGEALALARSPGIPARGAGGGDAGAAALVTRADLRRVLGVPVGPAEAYTGTLPTPQWLRVRSCRYQGTGGDPVTVDVHMASGPHGGYLMALGHLLTRVEGRRVPRMDGAAMLYPGVVSVRAAAGAVAIHVHSPAGPPPPGALIELARIAASRMERPSPPA